MCEPAPGPRCAAAAEADLLSARRAANEALTTLARAVAAADEDDPREERSRSRVDTHAARAAAVAAVRDVDEAQTVYDSTPKGQRELVAAIAATDPGADQLRTRLSTARAHREKVLTRWKASAVYAETQLAAAVAAADGDQTAHWRRTVMQRRCAEANILEPPSHPKAHRAWQYGEPDGHVWRQLTKHGVPDADADLTFMTPQVGSAAGYSGPGELLAAHYAALPAALVDDSDPTVAMRRAAGTGDRWAVDADWLTDVVGERGQRATDTSGDAAHDGQPGDEWAAQPVVGPVRLTGGPRPVDVDAGTLCVRLRDRLWRVLDDHQMSARFGWLPQRFPRSQPGDGIGRLPQRIP